jgi:phosphopantetheinyl transferase (holo-ACP synthase)
MARPWSSMARSELSLDVPPGFGLGHEWIAGDRHEAGREAARHALAALGCTAPLAYDGTRPIVRGTDITVSITHGRVRALAIAARGCRVGIDLCDDDPRLPALALRYFATEHPFATTPRQLAACLAAKEAGLKALGLGLLDGDMFDDCVIQVASLEPPRIRCALASLELVLGEAAEGAIAVVHDRTTAAAAGP